VAPGRRGEAAGEAKWGIFVPESPDGKALAYGVNASGRSRRNAGLPRKWAVSASRPPLQARRRPGSSTSGACIFVCDVDSAEERRVTDGTLRRPASVVAGRRSIVFVSDRERSWNDRQFGQTPGRSPPVGEQGG
jgi:hypothetical protein